MTSPTICANLKRAGLLDVAERAAKRSGLKLADCLVVGAVHPGHVALWRALAREGKTTAEVAELVGRREAEVAEVLREIPDPRPTPVPESGVGPRSSKPEQAVSAADVRAMIEAAVAPLRAALAAPRRTPTPFNAGAWLNDRGDLGIAVRALAARHGVPIADLLGRKRSKSVCVARTEAVRLLLDSGLSRAEAGVFLRRHERSITSLLTRNRARKAAA